MMYFIFFIAIVFNIFFNTKVPSSLGFEGSINTLAFLPMLIYFAINLIDSKIRFSKDVVYVIFLAVLIITFKWTIGQDYVHSASLLLIIPMFISMCFENLTKKELTLLRYITIIFFITECGLSIVEWALNQNLIYVSESTEYRIKSGFFRSTSLLGHPLANAQVVAVFMAFIAVSDFKRKYIQIILFILGYVSLFCFNSRGATLIVTIIIVPYFVWKINKVTQPNKKWLINFGVFCMFLGLFYMVSETSLGNRLTDKDLMDDSGQTRLEVFNFYKYYQHQDDFIWGHPDNYLYMMERLGAAGVENGIISMILEYGIIFTIPMLLLLFRFQYHKLSVYSKFDQWLLLAVFYIIGNMNPNLVVPVQWTLWIYAYYVFRPEMQTLQVGNTVTS